MYIYDDKPDAPWDNIPNPIRYTLKEGGYIVAISINPLTYAEREVAIALVKLGYEVVILPIKTSDVEELSPAILPLEQL